MTNDNNGKPTDEICPGCFEPIADQARTIVNAMPGGQRRLWHARCHQEAHERLNARPRLAGATDAAAEEARAKLAAQFAGLRDSNAGLACKLMESKASGTQAVGRAMAGVLPAFVIWLEREGLPKSAEGFADMLQGTGGVLGMMAEQAMLVAGAYDMGDRAKLDALAAQLLKDAAEYVQMQIELRIAQEPLEAANG